VAGYNDPATFLFAPTFMDRCWILLGMMGAGKSSNGRALADISGRQFLDTDQLLQQRLGRPIPQIFQIYGEETFRAHETSILRSLEPSPIVLATGGGIVTRSENWLELERLGLTIFLDATPQTLKDRLVRSKKKRPLLQTDEWETRIDQLLADRMPLYRRAWLTVAVDDVDLEDGAQKVLDAIGAVEK